MNKETDHCGEVIVYSTTYCGHCVRLKRQLEEAGVAYRSIDVDMNPGYGDRIVRATGGPRTVPAVEVKAGLLINPSLQEVLAAVSTDNLHSL